MAESWKARVRQFTNRVLNPCGLHLVRSDCAFEMDLLLRRAAANAIAVNTWIDVGASDGSWSLRARRHYPQANFLLFEPLRERQPALERLQRRCGFIPVAAAAGAAPGELSFAIAADLDGSGAARVDTPASEVRKVPVETIDRSVTSRMLAGPYGLKLDTHGHEIPVLEGAAAVLPYASLLIIEAYNFQLGSGCLRFHELCTWLEAAGFRCWNLADPMRRPSDGALWQMDLAFVPTTSPLFDSDRYS